MSSEPPRNSSGKFNLTIRSPFAPRRSSSGEQDQGSVYSTSTDNAFLEHGGAPVEHQVPLTPTGSGTRPGARASTISPPTVPGGTAISAIASNLHSSSRKMGVMGVVDPFFDKLKYLLPVRLPKEIIIQNGRISCLQIVLQVVVIVFLFVSFFSSRTYLVESSAQMTPLGWREEESSDVYAGGVAADLVRGGGRRRAARLSCMLNRIFPLERDIVRREMRCFPCHENKTVPAVFGRCDLSTGWEKRKSHMSCGGSPLSRVDRRDVTHTLMMS